VTDADEVPLEVESCEDGQERKALALLQVKSEAAIFQHKHQTAKQHQIRLDAWNWDAWNCDLNHDPCSLTCREPNVIDAIDPHNLGCDTHTCDQPHHNAFRSIQAIGSLPCCPTFPICAAPACAKASTASLVLTPQATCTKRSIKENLAYMQQPDAWTAYHGAGGSFELDISKVFDILGGCEGTGCAANPFDLVIDLGANGGIWTMKSTLRHFGKNYILVDAGVDVVRDMTSRLQNETWKQCWFTQQVPSHPDIPDAKMPEFEIFHQALSNHSGVLDLCQTQYLRTGCTVPLATVDSLLPAKLSPAFQEHFRQAQSAFLKIDVEGMDELVMRGMENLFKEQRGVDKDGNPNFLVNFLYFEFSPLLMYVAKNREGFEWYDLKSVTMFLESQGFETFMIGPRFLPLSHGSWDDEYLTLTSSAARNSNGELAPNPTAYRNNPDPTFCSDIFAIRASHPRAAEIKVALGACQESKDFDINDAQYATHI